MMPAASILAEGSNLLVVFFHFAVNERVALLEKTGEHLLWLTAVPVGLAVLIGVPGGVLVHRVPLLRQPLLGLASIVQTIPSLAMLALLQIVLGRIGIVPAITALALYAVLPILRNTYTGLSNVPAASIEAARGLGFRPAQRLWLVELPMALPIIIAGVRTSTVITVGIATLATLIGAGGLGDFIVSGLSLNQQQRILLGVIAAALLALLADGLIALIEKLLRKGIYHE